MCNIILVTFRQLYRLPGTLGRVTATMRFVTMGTSPLGAPTGGARYLARRLAVSGAPLLSRAFIHHRDLAHRTRFTRCWPRHLPRPPNSCKVLAEEDHLAGVIYSLLRFDPAA